MGYYCTVPQCTSLAGKTKNVKFHRFPRDTTLADKWNLILKRGKPYTKYSKVCSLHFTQADYNVTTMGQWKTLSKDAVPSQNLPKLHPDGTVMVIRKSRTVKYRETIKKEDGDKTDKWMTHMTVHMPHPTSTPMPPDVRMNVDGQESSSVTYTHRYPTLTALTSAVSHVTPLTPHLSTPHPLSKPKKQDAIMQTDPVATEDDDSQPNNSYSEPTQQDAIMQTDFVPSEDDDHLPNNSYSEVSEKYPEPVEQYNQSYQNQKTHESYQNQKGHESYQKGHDSYQSQKGHETYQKGHETYQSQKGHDYDKHAKDYTKQTEEYLPKTNEEYNKEAEKYALERKSLNTYEKALEAYQKLPDPYSFDKGYQRTDYVGYQGYPDSAELLRNQQNNLQILQEQHRITENQNFFNENHIIKQEVDNMSEEEKFLYERNKEQLLDADLYNNRRLLDQQRLLDQIQHQVKQEPDTSNGCENVMQPQGSPYYQTNTHNNVQGCPVAGADDVLITTEDLGIPAESKTWRAPTPYSIVDNVSNISIEVGGGYYDPLSRPGPELLIAKQNALAAHTQLWQNTMKRPFFYSESPHYNSAQLLHRCEEFPRILQ